MGLKTMETGKLELFLTTKKRRPKDKLVATQECLVYCNCRLPEFGVMFCCGNCCESGSTKTVSLRLKLFLMILIIGCIYVRVAKFEFVYF